MSLTVLGQPRLKTVTSAVKRQGPQVLPPPKEQCGRGADAASQDLIEEGNAEGQVIVFVHRMLDPGNPGARAGPVTG